MITPDYNIVFSEADTPDWSRTRLVIQWSKQYLHYVVVQDEDTIVALKHYNWAPLAGRGYVELLEEIISVDEVLQKNIPSVSVIYNVPENHLVPLELYDESCDSELINLLHGDLNKGTVLSDTIENTAIHTVYSVPEDVHEYFQRQFMPSQFLHFYSAWIDWKEQEELKLTNCLYIVFYPNEFQVMLVRDKILQLIQRYTYEVVEDVAYHLLNIYRQFNLSTKEFPLRVSGMVAIDSEMYNELLKYFLHVETIPTPGTIKQTQSFEDFPAHFFSPMLKIAVCV